VVAIEAIEAEAKMNCAILRIKPRKVPGVPEKFFILLALTNLRNLKAKIENPY
jgi:hypothetical protein